MFFAFFENLYLLRFTTSGNQIDISSLISERCNWLTTHPLEHINDPPSRAHMTLSVGRINMWITLYATIVKVKIQEIIFKAEFGILWLHFHQIIWLKQGLPITTQTRIHNPHSSQRNWPVPYTQNISYSQTDQETLLKVLNNEIIE